eukprot:2368324-Pleurochrysis_carterae.AAC.1
MRAGTRLADRGASPCASSHTPVCAGRDPRDGRRRRVRERRVCGVARERVATGQGRGGRAGGRV